MYCLVRDLVLPVIPIRLPQQPFAYLPPSTSIAFVSLFQKKHPALYSHKCISLTTAAGLQYVRADLSSLQPSSDLLACWLAFVIMQSIKGLGCWLRKGLKVLCCFLFVLATHASWIISIPCCRSRQPSYTSSLA